MQSTATTAIQTRSSISIQPPLPSRTWRSTLEFEYIGQTALTVVGPISGQRYEFRNPGAVLAIDVRDRRFLSGIPNLKQA